MRLLIGSLLVFIILPGPVSRAEEAAVLERAQQHYRTGVSLFESGNKDQALVEFQMANAIAPKKENIFMLAQCEYHLGQILDARTHYQAYLAEESTGELADLARVRIEAINRRPGVLAIHTVPDKVDIRIEGEGQVITGQAPSEFRVPRGHYTLTVRKANFASETQELSIDVGETKPLFFRLEPIPAHLTVRTHPPHASLFVRGNRTRNPYVQDVPAGAYEIYAEAPFFQPRREAITVGPGEDKVVDFSLTYVQRSGRPELLAFWTGLGAAGGGLIVLALGDPRNLALSLSVPVFGAGLLAGGIGLGVIASTTPLVPDYIPDNLALFRIGAMWIGDLEGATFAMGLTHYWTPTWVGGVVGLTGGALVGWWLDSKAPNYGRVALIQSAALWGTLAGVLAIPALGAYPAAVKAPAPEADCTAQPQLCADYNHYRNQTKQRIAWGMLAGLNAGLATGLAMAYLPNQAVYGPTWQRVLMVDLAGVAGAILATGVEVCARTSNGSRTYCATPQNTQGGQDTLTHRTAQFALVGAALGIVTGYLLTLNYDKIRQDREARPDGNLMSFIPLPGVVPVESQTGTAELVPGLMSQGHF